MNKEKEEQIREMLRKALPPTEDTELRRDLWPEMLRKVEQRPVQVPWFDWALAALVGAAFLLFPGVMPALLYHL